METRRFRRRLTWAAALPAAASAVSSAVFVALVFYLMSVYQWVDHTDRVITQATLTEKLMSDSETGLRGYQLTRDPAFLQPFEKAQAELPATLDQLANLVADNAGQKNRVGQLSSAIRDWSKSAMDARYDLSIAAEERLVRKAAMDNIREDLSRFLATESGLRSGRVARAGDVARWTVGATLAIGLSLAVGLSLTSRNQLRGATAEYRKTLERNLVQTAELALAYKAVDRELEAVAAIQRSLLPASVPNIPGLDIAADYATSRHAGGDYYDFFPLAEGRWGILIADVSGHGTPAAVLMAVTHSLAHNPGGVPAPPSTMLAFVNRRLCEGYTTDTGTFVTAFYGVFDPVAKTLTYSCAGHPPPRVYRAPHGEAEIEPTELFAAQSLPLGVDAGEKFIDSQTTLEPGETLVLYTDGITEAGDDARNLFGNTRFDEAVQTALREPLTDAEPKSDKGCDAKSGPSASAVLGALLKAVQAYSPGPATDDRTVLVLRLCGDESPAEENDLALAGFG